MRNDIIPNDSRRGGVHVLGFGTLPSGRPLPEDDVRHQRYAMAEEMNVQK
jgi:hypothetical protein